MYSCRSKKSKADSFIISIIFLSLFLIPNILSLPSPPSRSAASFPEGARPHAAEGYSKEQDRHNPVIFPTRYYNQRCPG